MILWLRVRWMVPRDSGGGPGFRGRRQVVFGFEHAEFELPWTQPRRDKSQ